MSWTQPICAARYNQDCAARLGRNYAPLAMDLNGPGEEEQCCYCGMPTRCGIYLCVDPATVPYPQRD